MTAAELLSADSHDGLPRLRRFRLGEILTEVSRGVGDDWPAYRLLGATRQGLALAKEGVGKDPGRYKLVEPGTIFYNPMRILIGSIAMVDEGDEPGITSPDYVVFTCRPGMLHPRFFYYWLRSMWGEDFIKRFARGAVRERILFRRLAEAEIDLPPWPAQVRAAEALRLLDRPRRLLLEQIEAARALPAAYLSAAFRFITPLSTDASRPTAPPGWRWHPLSELARLESGHTPSRRHPEWWGGDIPWIALPDIRALDGQVVMETAEYTNVEGIANSSARVLPAGTVVLSRTASVGFVTVMGRPMATSQDFVNWVCGPELDPHFLALLLRASRDFILSLASGAVHKTVYVPTVQSFQVCIPEIDVQRRMVEAVAKQLQMTQLAREAAETQLSDIDTLPAAILRLAFMGAL